MVTFYKKTALACAVAAASAVLSALPMSVEAEVGRPGTPGSVAGVARRTERRAVRRCAAGVTCNY
jgi:hypothetical protein